MLNRGLCFEDVYLLDTCFLRVKAGNKYICNAILLLWKVEVVLITTSNFTLCFRNTFRLHRFESSWFSVFVFSSSRGSFRSLTRLVTASHELIFELTHRRLCDCWSLSTKQVRMSCWRGNKLSDKEAADVMISTADRWGGISITGT